MQSEWAVHFMESDGQTRIGPWLLCDSHDEVLRILRWGHITPEDLAEHHRSITQWGVGGGSLHLSSRERHQLIARGQGWPWNAYELRRMKEAGRYPPQPLSLAEEAAYVRSHAARTARR
jgi:hypothetical protein